LLEKGAEVDAQGEDYGTALHAASSGGYEKVVRLLLEKGINVNAQGGIYGTALQVASRGGYEKVVRLLLEKGADVNALAGKYGRAVWLVLPRVMTSSLVYSLNEVRMYTLQARMALQHCTSQSNANPSRSSSNSCNQMRPLPFI
jgi:ankyrin repeat protein